MELRGGTDLYVHLFICQSIISLYIYYLSTERYYLFIYIYIYIFIFVILKSSYKFKRAFFRHDRRTAPKFGTHVWIETRLALTKKN